MTTGEVPHLFHVIFNDAGYGLVILVGCLTPLEVDVRVLGSAPCIGMFRVDGPVLEFSVSPKVKQGGHVLILNHLDFLDFVGSSESVVEVKKRHPGFHCGQVGNQCQVLGFLNRRGGQHGKAGLACGHDILMVSKDGQGMCGYRAGCNMKNTGEQFAGYLIHIGDLEQKSLGCRKSGGQGACCQRPVNRTGRTGLGLHLLDIHDLAENILSPLGSPGVSNFTQWTGRGNRIYGSHLTHGVCHVGCRSISVNGLHSFFHSFHLVYRNENIH